MITSLYPYGISSGAIVICPKCNGEGALWFWDSYDEEWIWVECNECNGDGVNWQ